jgi:hypothetical protein
LAGGNAYAFVDPAANRVTSQSHTGHAFRGGIMRKTKAVTGACHLLPPSDYNARSDAWIEERGDGGKWPDAGTKGQATGMRVARVRHNSFHMDGGACCFLLNL